MIRFGFDMGLRHKIILSDKCLALKPNLLGGRCLSFGTPDEQKLCKDYWYGPAMHFGLGGYLRFGFEVNRVVLDRVISIG